MICRNSEERGDWRQILHKEEDTQCFECCMNHRREKSSQDAVSSSLIDDSYNFKDPKAVSPHNRSMPSSSLERSSLSTAANSKAIIPKLDLSKTRQDIAVTKF
jgi:hypothetical protein